MYQTVFTRVQNWCDKVQSSPLFSAMVMYISRAMVLVLGLVGIELPRQLILVHFEGRGLPYHEIS